MTEATSGKLNQSTWWELRELKFVLFRQNAMSSVFELFACASSVRFVLGASYEV